ncbi:hypothetical protein RUMHYD_01572 [Blautia hydrogenotrophica DSM 10507]|uniref:Uncharacterized protein n=1 Tax=Blautia hydrogenotrophica (strain DSM 10507 / JCM 14656 / S5a33) TaxID=476272 RepID=C0CL51_BLAHS|nr:hypothetical protein RUMHYD_01572 [Blautia hydrogenotrophica DSM 10507]
MVYSHRKLPKTVGAVRHKVQNAYRGKYILEEDLYALLSVQQGIFFWIERRYTKSIRRCTISWQK